MDILEDARNFVRVICLYRSRIKSILYLITIFGCPAIPVPNWLKFVQPVRRDARAMEIMPNRCPGWHGAARPYKTNDDPAS